jgi:hypothetical protein
MPYEAIDTPWDVVRNRCQGLIDMQVWEVGAQFNYVGWLSNFKDSERQHATALLNRFLYFNHGMLGALMTYSIRALSTRLIPERGAAQTAAWKELIRSAAITFLPDGDLRPADPALEQAAIARDLGLETIAPHSAIDLVCKEPERCLIVLDAFASDGEAFVRLWADRFREDGPSLQALASASPAPHICYCPCLATKLAEERIAQACKDVQLSPGQLFSPRYSVLAADSFIWPPALRATAPEFLHEASSRALAGCPATIEDWRGEAQLGLAIGFAHHAPSATIPLLRLQTPHWTPLIKGRT